jgi:hypothetical protein
MYYGKGSSAANDPVKRILDPYHIYSWYFTGHGESIIYIHLSGS